MLAALTVVEQTLHGRHRPPPGVRHVEVPERLVAARGALQAAPFAHRLAWQRALDSERTVHDAVTALERVHTIDHLLAVEGMSQRGGGFDSDTYCAPGSWEAMLDGTRAWLEATALAAGGHGPALALSRPAGHHATASVAMGFGLVNFAAAAVATHLAAHPAASVAVLDWDVHHGNGVASIFADEPRVRYCSTHEAGGFPGTGADADDHGPHGNLLHLPLPKGAGGDDLLWALRERALPFLLRPARAGSDGVDGSSGWTAPPELLLVCAGFDGLEVDPLGTMALRPADFAAAVRLVVGEFGFPRERVALGLEGGYDLGAEVGMPAALVAACGALVT